MQVPDLDAIIQTSDFPCMLRVQPGTGALAPPIFGYNSHANFVDIPFPDYSYWGHESRRLLGECYITPHILFTVSQSLSVKSQSTFCPTEQGSAHFGGVAQKKEAWDAHICCSQGGMHSQRMAGRSNSAS